MHAHLDDPFILTTKEVSLAPDLHHTGSYAHKTTHDLVCKLS